MTITRKEWVRVIGFALFAAALTTLPYLLAWQSQTADRAFSGALFGVEDANSYLAKMRAGAQGNWSFSLFYTPEPTDAEAFVFMPYVLSGQIIGAVVQDDAALPVALMVGYQIMRVVFGIVLVLTMYRFIARFIDHERVRYNALVLASLAGGLGWITLFVPFGARAMPDLTIPEGFTFLILYGLPHLALGRAAMLGGLILLMPAPPAPVVIHGDGIAPPVPRRVIYAGILFNVVGICVPFYLAVIYVILGVWGLARWAAERRFPFELARRAVPAAAMTIPLFVYNAWIFLRNPAFAQWSAQNILTSPPMFEYVIAYLPLGAFAVIAGRWAWNQAREKGQHALLIGWLIAVPILVYLPINVQRRLAEGVIVPLAILAAWEIRQLIWRDQIPEDAPPLPDDPRKRRAYQRGRTLRTLLIIFFLCSTTVVWISTGALASIIRNSPAYRDGAELRAFAWLEANSEPGSRVIAAWTTGNALPVYTDLRPMLGLGPETLLPENKEALIDRYYWGMLDQVGRGALYDLPCTNQWMRDPVPVSAECRVRYVLWGEAERELFPPDVTPVFPVGDDVRLVYEDGSYQIYEVMRDGVSQP